MCLASNDAAWRILQQPLELRNFSNEQNHPDDTATYNPYCGAKRKACVPGEAIAQKPKHDNGAHEGRGDGAKLLESRALFFVCHAGVSVISRVWVDGVFCMLGKKIVNRVPYPGLLLV